MVKFFIKIYDYLVNKRALVLGILLLVVVLFVISSLNLNYREDIADFLPITKENKRYTSVYNNLGGQNRIVLIFDSKNSGNITDYNGYDSLVSVISNSMDEFEMVFKSSSLSKYSDNLSVQTDESAFLDIIGFVNENYPYFLTDDDYLRMDSLLSDSGYISDQLENNKKMLMLPTAGMIANSLRYDPLHLYSPVLKRMQSFKVNDEYDVINGYLLNKNGTKGYAFFSSPFGISESKENLFVVNTLDSIILSVATICPGVSISQIGAPTIAVTNASQIKRDSILGLSIAVILIVLLLIYSFRRLDDLFWIVFSISFGWLFALAVISLITDSISIIVIGIGSIIIGIAVNYPLHYLDHIKHELEKRTALKEMVTPLLIGNITTVSAFLCLLALDAEAMRGLGLFGALTLVGTIIFVLIFLPVLVKPRKSGIEYFNVDFTFNNSFGRKFRFLVFVVFIVLTVFFGYFSFKTSFDSDIQNINYMTDVQRKNLKELAENSGSKVGMSLLYAVAEGSSLNEALYNNECLVNRIQNESVISGVNGFLPSKELQRERLDAWKRFWDKYPWFVDAFCSESKKAGFSETAFSPFISSVGNAFEVNEIEYFEPIYNFLNKTYIQRVDSVYRVVNFVNVGADSLDVVKGNVNNIGDGSLFAFDTTDVGNQLVAILSSSFNYIGFVCGFVVFVFLLFSFGRLEIAVISFLPLTIGWMWILGIMYLSDIQFNIVNIILATLIFGQGDDYTIFITEGLMYEYAYGKKTLKSYKNSIAVSAIIMLIGIGALIFAKHPAMRSLAIVSIIGMLTVLVMTYYIPPLVFRWLTLSKTKVREVPITIKRVLYSLYSIGFFIVAVYLFMYPVMFYFFRLKKVTEQSKLRYHRIIKGFSSFVIKRVPGVKFSLENRYGERFEKPAIIVANHQSHLDLMCLLMLSEKIIILTNDWVWNNPLYGRIIKYAEFYPVSDGVENNIDKMKSLVDRGYSIVVFPEGTRSEDCSIRRFHKGAFYLAQYLNVDIVPVILHGAGDVLPKNDFMLREGAIHVEIEKRVNFNEFENIDCKEFTQGMRRFFKVRYDEILKERANAQYYLYLVRYKYFYKGNVIEKRVRQDLRRINQFSAVIKDTSNEKSSVAILNSKIGVFAWLYALTCRNVHVHAYETDMDDFLISSNTSCIPDNLHFNHIEDYDQITKDNFDIIIDVDKL